ncbi:MAG TPA: Gfo/Idh/MocA family oxidoreductase [Pyrinomonadaceae bacterium]|nr:Gfo/Idh/MocA family oxidoreductase [Pyrinomonadaceae bacterium]
MLITGATGFIGSRLTTLAQARGYTVNTLSRSDWHSLPAVPMAQRFFGTFPHQIPPESLQGVDVVVHCAASIDPSERVATSVNVEGTIRLAELSRQARVKTFIFLSSQSARPDALSAYGKTKYAAEQALLSLDGLNVIIMRPGLVTGDGSRGLFQRMGRMVESLPVIPLLGGKAIVQPIHVDDLCEAIFRCAEAASTMAGQVLNLGHPEGLVLKEFLQAIAVDRLGRRKSIMPIPMWPVEIAVRLAEGVGIPLPINSGNIKGMKVVEKMETAADLKRLNLALRTLSETVHRGEAELEEAIPLTQRPVRVLLVGAGRVGLVHALTLSKLKGVVLCGVVDPNRKATGLMQGMGLSFPVFATLDEALIQTKPDATVIATPPATHLALARTCLERQVAVMIEKPLAVDGKQLADYKALAQEFPTTPVQVGYVMLRNPQVTAMIEKLRAGDFGKVLGFVGVTLLSLIQKTNAKRWEVVKKVSGGGALINAGGHVLSMIHEAFGDPSTIDSQSLKIYSSEVEDSIVLNLGYSDFSGRHYCSWSINGYPRQENRLIIRTERGHLILTASVGVFASNDGDVDITHQLDFDVPFNLAPDYAGGGFTNELNDLKQSVLTGQRAPVDLNKAIEVEQLLFKAYDTSSDTKSFADSDSGWSGPSSSSRLKLSTTESNDGDDGVRRTLDLRELSPEDIGLSIGSAASKSLWDDYQILPAQFPSFAGQSIPDERIRVTVPDFFTQTRLLATGRYGTVLKSMGAGGVTTAAWQVLQVVGKERGATFWVAAIGLVGAALHAVPPSFRGTIFLHVYITDLALTLGRIDILERMLAMCRRIRPHARLGLHTNMAAETLETLRILGEPVDEVSALSSPRALGIGKVFDAMRQVNQSSKFKLTAEVGLAPAIVHATAFNTPTAWAHGADAVLIGPSAHEALGARFHSQLERDWAEVFPGLGLPEGAI